MADTYVTCNVSPCQIITTLDVPILNIDEAGGGLIAGAIIIVWAVGWAFRVLVRALNVDGVSPKSEGE